MNLKKNVTQAVNGAKVTIKLVIIFGMILALLIPKLLIEDLIFDREGRQKDVIRNIAAQVGGSQEIVGPVLCVPYKDFIVKTVQSGKTTRKETEIVEHWAYFLPENLSINSEPIVTNKEKSIYKVPFFQSENVLAGTFAKPSFEKWDIKERDIDWKNTHLAVGVSDLRGLSTTPTCTVGSGPLEFEPGLAGATFLSKGIKVKVGKDWLNDGAFEIAIDLKGTQTLSFASVAQNNTMVMRSNWPHPDFEGNAFAQVRPVSEYGGTTTTNQSLPESSEITEDGFTANWKESSFGASTSSQWLQTEKQNFSYRNMGTRFININNHYKKTARSVKYMAMIISLVFLSFFLMEVLKGSRVHPFQYIMVGAAIAIFFVLLLAFSEYFGFNLSYLGAACATIVLIGLYSLSVFRNKGLSISVSLFLALLFSFIFVILTAAEYSLLLGAVGLFVILAGVMYFTRKVNWYGQESDVEVN